MVYIISNVMNESMQFDECKLYMGRLHEIGDEIVTPVKSCIDMHASLGNNVRELKIDELKEFYVASTEATAVFIGNEILKIFDILQHDYKNSEDAKIIMTGPQGLDQISGEFAKVFNKMNG